MLGAIAGDIIGSVYEFHPLKNSWENFPLFSERSFFTDDTVMTIAVANALMRTHSNPAVFPDELVESMRAHGRKWPTAGYGNRFAHWLMTKNPQPYNSYGNGSAMRVSPVGWFADSLEHAEKLAAESAAVTHNHPEGIKGAQAVAGSIYLAREGKSKKTIHDYVSSRYGYDLSRPLEEIRKTYCFNETCQESVPEAIRAFLESDNFEEAVRKAVWLRGDADTQAAIAGSIAEAFYGGVPDAIARESLARLDEELLQNYQSWTKWLNSKDRGVM